MPSSTAAMLACTDGGAGSPSRGAGRDHATGADDGERQPEADCPAGLSPPRVPLDRPDGSGQLGVVLLQGRLQLVPAAVDGHGHAALLGSIVHVVPPSSWPAVACHGTPAAGRPWSSTLGGWRLLVGEVVDDPEPH